MREGIDVAGRQLKLLKLLKAEVNGHALLLCSGKLLRILFKGMDREFHSD